MSDSLADAAKEYRAAKAACYRVGEAGWIDEHQLRIRRLVVATNALLDAAENEPFPPESGHEEKP